METGKIGVTTLASDLRALCAVAMLIIALAAPSYAAEEIAFRGRAVSVIDGDSIQVDDAVYNLAGIDAPELGQICDHGGHLSACGLAAAYELRKQLELETTPIRCRIVRTEDVATATCTVVDAEISVMLLEGGYVTALPEAEPHYAAAERSAKAAALGIWGSTFVPPAEWRAGKRLPAEHAFGASSHLRGVLPWKLEGDTLLHDPKTQHMACLVKGVVTTDNERLYYGPLDEEFESLEIDPTRGERLFCGDDEARRAGWTRKGEKPSSGG